MLRVKTLESKHLDTGLKFHHQALVPDPAAGNAAGAVVSDAAVAIVGW